MITFSSQTLHLCSHFCLCSHSHLGSDFIVTFSYFHCSFYFNGPYSVCMLVLGLM